MALRTGHGTSAAGGQPLVIEVPPPDELGPITPGVAPDQRRGRGYGKPFDSSSARRAGAKGGRRKGELSSFRRALERLGLQHIAVGPENEQHIIAADDLRREQAGQLARFSGGKLGPAPCSVLASAALQKAGEAILFEEALRMRKRDPEGAANLLMKARMFGDSARQNLLAAHHLAELEAKSERMLSRRKTLSGEGSGGDDADEKASEKRRREEEVRNAGAITVRGDG